jgi:hypothetical protein
VREIWSLEFYNSELLESLGGRLGNFRTGGKVSIRTGRKVIIYKIRNKNGVPKTNFHFENNSLKSPIRNIPRG